MRFADQHIVEEMARTPDFPVGRIVTAYDVGEEFNDIQQPVALNSLEQR